MPAALTKAFCAGWYGFEVIDVSDPAEPDGLAVLPCVNVFSQLAVSGNHAYLSSWGTELIIVDLSDETAPVQVGTLEIPGEIEDMIAASGHLYVTGFTGSGNALRVYDLATPAAPSLVATIADANYDGELSVTTGPGGNTLTSINRDDHLLVATIDTPGSPVLRSDTVLADTHGWHCVEGGMVYLQYDDDSVGVVDISDPTAPVERGKLAAGTLDYPLAMDYGEGYLCVIGDSGGFWIVDVSNPDALSVTATLEIPVDGADVFYRDKYAHVSCEENGMLVVELMDPADPVIMGLLQPVGEAGKIRLLRNLFLVVCDPASGLTVAYRDCGYIVPVALSSFTAEVTPGCVDLRWETAAGSDPSEFRVVATGEGESWTVPCGEVVPGMHSATDRAEILTGGGDFTYVLTGREAGGDWQLLRSRAVRVEAVFAAEGIAGAWPNPFNPHVTIAFQMAEAGPARLAIYDLSGRRVADLVEGGLAAGEHEATWDGRDEAGESVASGIYLARLITRRGVDRQRLVLVR